MTGYQSNFGTLGGDTVRIPIEKISRGFGVNSVKVVNPYKLKKSIRAYKKMLTARGVNVLILRGPCVARQPRTWDLAVRVNPKKCQGFEGCERTCIEALACPAIIRDGDDVRINQEECQSCGLCVNYCPSAAIRSSPFKIRRKRIGI